MHSCSDVLQIKISKLQFAYQQTPQKKRGLTGEFKEKMINKQLANQLTFNLRLNSCGPANNSATASHSIPSVRRDFVNQLVRIPRRSISLKKYFKSAFISDFISLKHGSVKFGFSKASSIAPKFRSFGNGFVAIELSKISFVNSSRFCRSLRELISTIQRC